MMSYNEAYNVIYGYLETYIAPSPDFEDALYVAMLALKRCDYLDEQLIKRKDKKKEK